MIHPHIAGRIFNTPLAIHRGKAAAMVAGIGQRVLGSPVMLGTEPPVHHVAGQNRLPVHAGTLTNRVLSGVPRPTSSPLYDMVGNVAVIPVEGTLVHKGAWVETDSGETSYQGLQAQVQRAMKDPGVRGVVFEIDSYGGQVSGVFETAQMMSQLSALKPTLAILTDEAYSAGYMLASACRQIVVPESGGAGSIGVITMHTDMSAALADAGYKVTILAAGAHKADMNPFEPLPADVADTVMNELQGLREQFCRAVAANRGDRLTFDAAMATEAQCYGGADAVKMGLADATGTPFETFQAFISQLNRA